MGVKKRRNQMSVFFFPVDYFRGIKLEFSLNKTNFFILLDFKKNALTWNYGVIFMSAETSAGDVT